MTNKLTDLELRKRIAEIEGELPTLNESISARNKSLAKVQRKITILDAYNPLTNKALLFDLMADHDVSICRYSDKAFIESDYTDKPHKASVSFSGKEEMPRAILECIVEANE